MTGTTRHLLALALGAGLFAGSALAQTTAKPATTAQPAATQAGPSAEELFRSIDKNSDKSISLDEFKASLDQQRTRMQMLQRLQAQFKSVDKNKNGTLELVEFNELPLVKNAKPAPTFSEADANRDQKIDFREYVGLIARFATAAQAAQAATNK